MTLPPRRSRVTSFEWPVIRSRRRRLISVLATAAVAAIAIVVAVAVTGDDTTDTADAKPATTSVPPRPTTTPPVQDLTVDAADRVGLALSDSSLYVTDPDGRLVRLDRESLRTQAAAAHPAAPTSIALAGGTAYVAGAQALYRLDPNGFRPIAVGAAPGSTTLVGGANRPLAAVTARDGTGRLCLVDDVRLHPCADLPFAPSGAGIRSSSELYVANEAAGTVVPVERTGDKLELGEPIEVGAKPHGALLPYRGRLYVPVEARGRRRRPRRGHGLEDRAPRHAVGALDRAVDGSAVRGATGDGSGRGRRHHRSRFAAEAGRDRVTARRRRGAGHGGLGRRRGLRRQCRRHRRAPEPAHG